MLDYIKKPLTIARPSRRGFLLMSVGAAGGLVLGLSLSKEAMGATGEVAMPFIKLGSDGSVIVMIKHLDKGQGIATGLAAVVADELDVDADMVKTNFAPANVDLYANLMFGIQGTGGSTSMANSFPQYREAGATLRAMLKAAAAAEWGVSADTVRAELGVLTSGRNSASYGEMAGVAATQPIPTKVALKSPSEWRYIGKDFPRVDLPQKSTGSQGLFGMDVQLDDMLVAVTARPPRFGGGVASFDGAAAKSVRGVVDVIAVPQGVVVLANSTWAAIKGREALTVKWDFSAAENRGTKELLTEYRALLDKPGLPAQTKGDAKAALDVAAHVVELDFEFPFLAHAPLEPIDITILYDGATAEIWTGSQMQTLDHNETAKVLGLQPEKIVINTLWAGGSFGRRGSPDSHYTAEAATIAKAWYSATGKAQPIKLMYTREDDVRGGYYRPMTLHRVKAGVGADGKISGWQHRIVGQSIMMGTVFEPHTVKNGVDHFSIEGALNTTYSIPDMSGDVHQPVVGVKPLFWRSVGHTHTAYVMEVMMDALAEASGQDAVAFRLAHLDADPRLAGVLKLAAEKSGWDTAAPEGRHRGIAVHKSFNTYVAEVAEVSMRDDGTVKVEKVVAAVDCGTVVHPDSVVAQVQGGIGYGLSAILREEVTLTDGEVDQSNFPDYMPLRITDMPKIDVHLVASAEAPTGIGEPGTPPIGPAVANAVAKGTGKRLTSLPLAKHGLAV